jgi:hypothetical protein
MEVTIIKTHRIKNSHINIAKGKVYFEAQAERGPFSNNTRLNSLR